jgi:hypothetical protein
MNETTAALDVRPAFSDCPHPTDLVEAQVLAARFRGEAGPPVEADAGRTSDTELTLPGLAGVLARSIGPAIRPANTGQLLVC